MLGVIIIHSRLKHKMKLGTYSRYLCKWAAACRNWHWEILCPDHGIPHPCLVRAHPHKGRDVCVGGWSDGDEELKGRLVSARTDTLLHRLRSRSESSSVQ